MERNLSGNLIRRVLIGFILMVVALFNIINFTDHE